jgi:hypothetical protein
MILISDTENLNDDFQEALSWVRNNTDFPSLQQFMRNPDKYRLNKEDIFESIDKMQVYFKHRVKKAIIMWRGKYRARSTEQLQQFAFDDGFSGEELEYEPIAKPMDGTSNNHDDNIEIIINVWPKTEFRSMGGIVAND